VTDEYEQQEKLFNKHRCSHPAVYNIASAYAKQCNKQILSRNNRLYMHKRHSSQQLKFNFGIFGAIGFRHIAQRFYQFT
jgi:hypothetical protein